MRSDPATTALADIQQNILLAQSFVEGMSFDGFAADIRTVYAVTRCLEIISEASRRLGDDLKERHPELPWRQIAAAGNIYRHDYEDVIAQIVWNTVRTSLPDLHAVVSAEILGGH